MTPKLNLETFPIMPADWRIKLTERKNHNGSPASALWLMPAPPFDAPKRMETLYFAAGQRQPAAGHAALIRIWFDRRAPFCIKLPSIQDGTDLFTLLAGSRA